MKTGYTGLYYERNANGMPDSVQVRDLGGNSIPLPLDEYLERGVMPLLKDLPDKESYYKLLSSK